MSMSTPPDVTKQAAELFGLLGYWKTVSGIFAPLVSLLPLSALYFDFLGCPGFEKYQAVVASVASLIVVAFMYYVFRNRDEVTIERWSNLNFVAGLVCGALYILLLFNLVAYVDDERHLTGFTLSNRANLAIKNKEIISQSPKALLDYFGYDSADDIWTARWLARSLLFFLSTAIFSLLATAFFLRTLRSFVHDNFAARSGDLANSAPPTPVPTRSS